MPLSFFVDSPSSGSDSSDSSSSSDEDSDSEMSENDSPSESDGETESDAESEEDDELFDQVPFVDMNPPDPDAPLPFSEHCGCSQVRIFLDFSRPCFHYIFLSRPLPFFFLSF